MQLDCQNLECPEPVIRTKKALEDLNSGEKLEVIVSDKMAFENVKRYAKSMHCEVEENNLTLIITKGDKVLNQECDYKRKVLFIKDNKVGEGELGEKLIEGFLSTLYQSDNIPSEIILVNKGVLLACTNENTIAILKNIQNKGCVVFSCGVCLDAFGVETQVGEVGNGLYVVETLMSNDNQIVSI